MHVNVKRSKEFIMKGIKLKLLEISEQVHPKNNPFYKNELDVYSDFGDFSTYRLAEKTINKTTLFGYVIHKDKEYKDLLVITLNEFELEVYIIDPTIAEIAKEKFTDFADLYRNNIFIVTIIKDF